jgi:hypothetical protein
MNTPRGQPEEKIQPSSVKAAAFITTISTAGEGEPAVSRLGEWQTAGHISVTLGLDVRTPIVVALDFAFVFKDAVACGFPIHL